MFIIYVTGCNQGWVALATDNFVDIMGDSMDPSECIWLVPGTWID